MNDNTKKDPLVEGKLAGTTESLIARLNWSSTLDCYRLALDFKPLPSDIFIATYPKCGTTWTQQIAHSIRSKANIQFDNINHVVPWLELGVRFGMNPYSEQPGSYRLFKTNFCQHKIPKGGKIICVIRDPKDCLISYYHFLSGMTLNPNAITLEAFAQEFFITNKCHSFSRYWDHLGSYLSVKESTNLIFVCFEGLKKNLEQSIKQISIFMEGGIEESALEKIIHLCSFDYMSKHADKFGDPLPKAETDTPQRLQESAVTVRSGRIGDHKNELSETTIEQLDETWRKTIHAQFGYESYEKMCQLICAN